MKTVKPRYIEDRDLNPNYGPGYIGFSYTDNNIVSQGIAMFTREEYDGIVPSHCFMVKDKNTIVEAFFPYVREHSVHDYIEDPHKIVFFKKPNGLTDKEKDMILFVAVLQIGHKYDTSLFGYFLLRWLLRRLGRWEPFKDKPAWGDSPEEWVCSELIAHCLKQIDKYSNLFPLSDYHPSKIDPLMLFRSEIFKDWNFDEGK